MTPRIHRWRATVVPAIALVVALGGAPGASAHQTPASSAAAPTLAPERATVATAATTAPTTVRKRSITLQTGPTLHVNVNPNLKGKRSWKLRLQRLGTTGWRTLGTYRTQGKAETRSFTVAAGTYRVKVSAGHGRKARTSGVLVHRPPAPKPSPPVPPPAPKPAPKPVPPPKPAPVARVTLGASMTPAASPGISDYVLPCASGQVTATITAANGGAVAFDGSAPLTASTTRTVALTAGQRLSWVLLIPGAAPVTQHARCLPDDFPLPLAQRQGTPASQWYLLSPSIFSSAANQYAMLLDNRGTPVWWMATGSRAPLDLSLLPDGRVAWVYPQYLSYSQETHYQTFDWAGRAAGDLGRGLSLDHHDLQPSADGRYLAVRYVPRRCPTLPSDCTDMTAWGGWASATLIDGEVVEFDEAGQVVWRWSTRGRIALQEAEGHLGSSARLGSVDGRDTWDVVHLNSVARHGDGVIISARHTDAVYRVDRTTGSITWKLGGTPTPESLTVVGLDADDAMFAQHDARILPDGTLSVFDNGGSAHPPRVLVFAIDDEAREARLVRSLAAPETLTSGCCGSARAVPGGGFAIGWGGTALLTEADSTGATVLRLSTTGGFSYRFFPIPPGELGPATVRAGMDAMHPRPS